ncbi:MAG: PHP domain-containing protein [Acetatifactor sp.]|nr:PHP domain-containing protein [Acetatifactor sp.]
MSDKIYTVYHLHDDTSNVNGFADSCSNFKEYIKLAKKQGMKAIAFSNHGGIYDWIKKKQECDKAGIKYIKQFCGKNRILKKLRILRRVPDRQILSQIIRQKCRQIP